MSGIEIYNLDVGNKVLNADKNEARFQSITLTLVEDYTSIISRLSHSTQKEEQVTFSDSGIENTPKYIYPNEGEWVVTATARVESSENEAESIFTFKPLNDGGVWDLCEILTFLTGRRVTTKEGTKQYNHKSIGVGACAPHNVLWFAEIAMKSRSNLAEKNIVEAMLLHNEAMSQNSMMIVAAMVNSAFNILLDRLSDSVQPVPKKVKSTLKAEINKIIDSCLELSPEHRVAYRAMVGAKIDQGTDSMVDKIKRLLLKLGVINEPIEPHVMDRVKYLNTVRNLSTHAGKIPKLKGLDEEQSLRYAASIVTGVIPEICCMAIGAAFGLYREGDGYSGLFKDNLSDFFGHGIWRGWKLEVETFDEWFYE